MALLLIAGIDTSWSAIGASLWHLAKTAADRRRLVAEPGLLLSFPAANHDPAQFGRADEVVIDREVNRHAAFGLGIHRCLGSHLARMELRVALEVWLERIPEFSLADPSAVTWATGQIRGPRTLPSASAEGCHHAGIKAVSGAGSRAAGH
jgi:cytochrome P450